MEVSREKGPGEFRRERQQTQNELLLFLCPRKNMKEHLLKLTMCLAPCCDYLTESALQMYYYLHLMDEETVVYRLHTPPSSGPSDRAGFEPRSSSRRRYTLRQKHLDHLRDPRSAGADGIRSSPSLSR